MAVEIKMLKEIGKLNKDGLALTLTEVKGVKKYDIRTWKKDGKTTKGVRLTEDEIGVLKGIISGIKKQPTTKIEPSKKQNIVVAKEYGVVATNGTTELRLNYVRWYENEPCFDLRSWTSKFARGGITLTFDELKKLEEVIPVKAKKGTVEKPTPKKITSTSKNKTTTKKKATTKKKKEKVYSSAYEKFVEQFTQHAESQQDDNKKEAYKMFYEIITDHIKDIEEVSDDYKANALKKDKNSYEMMKFVESESCKYVINNGMMKTIEEEKEFILQKVDEYIGS